MVFLEVVRIHEEGGRILEEEGLHHTLGHEITVEDEIIREVVVEDMTGREGDD